MMVRPRNAHRRRAVLSVSLLLALAFVSGCSSGNDGAQPTSTTRAPSPAAGSPPGNTTTAGTRSPSETVTLEPVASPQSTPTATPIPEPTASPSPTVEPTPVELTFDAPDDWDGTMTPPSTGPLGIAYAQSNIGYYIATPNRLHVWAAVYVGVNEHPAASAWLFNRFTTPGTGSTPVTARVSTSVVWRGLLAGNGAVGTRASVAITLSVLEGGRVLASKPVHALEQSASVLTVGGFRDLGEEEVEMEVSLVPGSEYELRLTAKCEAASGAIGVATSCVYGAKVNPTGGYVEWQPRTIVFVAAP